MGIKAICSTKGFSLLELLVVSCLVLIFVSVMVERIHDYQKIAESYSVQEMKQELTAALRIATLDKLAAGKVSDSAWFGTLNPLKLLKLPAAIDGGTWDGDGQPGCWYYYPVKHEVVYVFHYNNFMDRLLDNKKIVRFRVIGNYNAFAGKGLFVKLISLPVETLSATGAK